MRPAHSQPISPSPFRQAQLQPPPQPYLVLSLVIGWTQCRGKQRLHAFAAQIEYHLLVSPLLRVAKQQTAREQQHVMVGLPLRDQRPNFLSFVQLDDVGYKAPDSVHVGEQAIVGLLNGSLPSANYGFRFQCAGHRWLDSSPNNL